MGVRMSAVTCLVMSAMILPVRQSPISRPCLGARNDTGGKSSPLSECPKFGGLLRQSVTQERQTTRSWAPVCTYIRRWTFVFRKRENRGKKGKKWVGMCWHLTENWLEGLHSGMEPDQTLKYRPELTPFVDTHDTLNTIKTTTCYCLCSLCLTSCCFLHVAVMSRWQETHEVLITDTQHSCISVKRREWGGREGQGGRAE